MSFKVLIIGGYGYVGSHLCSELENTRIKYEICDIGVRGKPDPTRKALMEKDLVDLTSDDLRGFDCIVNVGGTSSVNAALKNPIETLKNNVMGHQHLLTLTKMENKRYIYASSGSVYNGSHRIESMESDPLTPSHNIYDFSKVTSDELSRINSGRWTSLRFGTVIGPSPNMRHELVINKMVRDALIHKEITVANEESMRAILSIHDLTNIVIKLLEEVPQANGIFNLASFNASMLELAEGVSAITGAKIRHSKPTSTYDFSMSTEKIRFTLPNIEFDGLEKVVFRLIGFYNSKK